MVQVPSRWSHISKGNNQYLYGICINSKDSSYDFIVTDLDTNFWVESINRPALLEKLDENGIDIVQEGKILEFLQLFESVVNTSDKVVELEERRVDNDVNMTSTINNSSNDIPLKIRLKLKNEKLNWQFTLKFAKDHELDKSMKFQLFNFININKHVTSELYKQINLKDRIITTLLENFLELNQSFNSSIDDDDSQEFLKKIDSSKQLQRIFPAGKLRQSLSGPDYRDLLDKVSGEMPNIWDVIKSSIDEDTNIWKVSTNYTTVVQTRSKTQTPIPVKSRKPNSDFVNFDDLPPASFIERRSSSPKRRRIASPKLNQEEEVQKTPSPSKEKTFGVIGGSRSRKRKLKASTNSPIKAPRII